MLKDIIVDIVKNSFSYRECKTKANEQGYNVSETTLRRKVKELALDTSHFKYANISRHNKDSLTVIVSSSFTYAECLRKMGLRIAGGNYKLLQRNIDKYNIDCSHMHYLSVTQGSKIKSFDNLISNDSIKSRLFEERGRKCESCLLDNWLNKPITIELEHIDGDNRNNERSNLRLLCPNCHSQTPTWRNRKRK